MHGRVIQLLGTECSTPCSVERAWISKQLAASRRRLLKSILTVKIVEHGFAERRFSSTYLRAMPISKTALACFCSTPSTWFIPASPILVVVNIPFPTTRKAASRTRVAGRAETAEKSGAIQPGDALQLDRGPLDLPRLVQTWLVASETIANLDVVARVPDCCGVRDRISR